MGTSTTITFATGSKVTINASAAHPVPLTQWYNKVASLTSNTTTPFSANVDPKTYNISRDIITGINTVTGITASVSGDIYPGSGPVTFDLSFKTIQKSPTVIVIDPSSVRITFTKFNTYYNLNLYFVSSIDSISFCTTTFIFNYNLTANGQTYPSDTVTGTAPPSSG